METTKNYRGLRIIIEEIRETDNRWNEGSIVTMEGAHVADIHHPHYATIDIIEAMGKTVIDRILKISHNVT